ncbi:MAG: hypothetical protein F6K11_20100 [Leptolyngbya sp. SIO3F4]|nr:hypothetical protein [Leptolyngbya sp. SIO3F4]
MTVVAQWDFKHTSQKADQMGNFDDLILENGAQFTSDGLNLGPSGRAFGGNYQGDLISGSPISQKTLVSYLKLNSLGDRPGGSGLTIQTGNSFDGIVFSEEYLHGWECGSDNLSRTKRPNPFSKEATENDPGIDLQMVVTYEDTNDPVHEAKMTLYRNQVNCGSYSLGRLQLYPPGKNTQVVFGARFLYHPNDWRGKLDATIIAAQIHDVALSPQQVAKLSIEDITGTGPLKVGNKIQLQFSDAEPLYGYVTTLNRLELGSIDNAATFTVVNALEPAVPPISPGGMTPISLQLNDGRYLVRGNKRTGPGRLNGWYYMALMDASDPEFDKKAAVLQPLAGSADELLLSFTTTGTGNNKWMKVDSGFLFSGPLGAPRYRPLATWKAHKIS